MKFPVAFVNRRIAPTRTAGACAEFHGKCGKVPIEQGPPFRRLNVLPMRLPALREHAEVRPTKNLAMAREIPDRVMVVDDEPLIRWALCTALAAAGFDAPPSWDAVVVEKPFDLARIVALVKDVVEGRGCEPLDQRRGA